MEKDDSTLQFTPAYIEQSNIVVFKFVRGDGNEQKNLLTFYNSE